MALLQIEPLARKTRYGTATPLVCTWPISMPKP